ncbi:MAG: hypothetical protein GY822_06525 [Deltaproteobacteria bacterium]|nr:hypothetical protein [Deltaproteobacteria bacterium]
MSDLMMVPLESTNGVTVEQSVEMMEVFSDYETSNQYSVYDDNGELLLFAAEEDGGCMTHITRQMMSSRRPLVMWVTDATGEVVLELKKPFAFYFHKMEVLDGDGELLGTIQREFALLKRRYTLRSPSGEIIYEVDGAFWKPWTFDVSDEKGDIAQVKKQFSGLLQEMVSDADNFGVEWAEDLAGEDRLMLISMVFFLDLLHFESGT